MLRERSNQRCHPRGEGRAMPDPREGERNGRGREFRRRRKTGRERSDGGRESEERRGGPTICPDELKHNDLGTDQGVLIVFAESAVPRHQGVTFDVPPPSLVNPVVSVTILEVWRPESVSSPTTGHCTSQRSHQRVTKWLSPPGLGVFPISHSRSSSVVKMRQIRRRWRWIWPTVIALGHPSTSTSNMGFPLPTTYFSGL